MPNILRRPMFRRGGSSQGTGITSGLERQNFEDKGVAQTAPNPEMDKQKLIIDYVSDLKKQAQPTTLQRLGDFMTAFGASKGLDLGASLQDTGAKFQQLQAARQQRVDKYATALDQQLLNIFGSSEKVTAAMTNAKEFAKINYKDFPGNTDKEKYDNAYKKGFNDQINKQKAQTSILELVRDKEKYLRRTDEIKIANKRPYAETTTYIEEGKIPGVKGYAGPIKVTSSGESDIIIVGDGKTATVNKKKTGYKPSVFKRRYQVNQNYVDPVTGYVFQYKGGGAFTRVYP